MTRPSPVRLVRRAVYAVPTRHLPRLSSACTATSTAAAVVRSEVPPYVERTHADRSVAAGLAPRTWVTRCGGW